MSSFAESSPVEARSFLATLMVGAAACLLMLGGAGCYDHHLCGSPETCDYADNDCDFVADEDFVNEAGVYDTAEHCGGCGVRCADVFPTAAETECAIDDEGAAGCRIVACPPGHHLAGDGACIEDLTVLCLPCTTDADCLLRGTPARCVDTLMGMRCAPVCESSADCPEGSSCTGGGFCLPNGGDCTCNEMNDGLELGCIFDRGDGHRCGGVQVCEDGGLESGYAFSECRPVHSEACDGQDDDCDGSVDEDFRDDAGRYVDRLHCGGCAIPCVEPGPNMVATCEPRGPSVTCIVECAEGFVDVDTIQANGCECERWDGVGPPPMVGGDADCDGIPDDSDDFVYVTATGSDANPGTLARPVRTLARAQAVALREGKSVLVARGIYPEGLDVVAGVDVYGGYRPDFRDRDLALYPVLIERRDDPPGSPVLVCNDVRAPTRIEGFILGGSDALAVGEGSTTAYFDNCGASVRVADVTVLAARGAAGLRGDDSSGNLPEWGLVSLEQLNGTDGGEGAGTGVGSCAARAGASGRHSCRAVDVSGGAGGAGACPDLRCTNGSACGNAGCTDFTRGGVCDLDAALRVAAPNPSAGSGRGLLGGAAGERTYNAPTNRGVCNFCDDNPTLPRNGGNGGDGQLGTSGSGGAGCRGGPILSSATGRVSAGGGMSGTDGRDGSGGGGATAGGGYAVIGGTEAGCTDRAGGAGGGGGSGGCGAPRADGGSGGGTSAGIVIRLVAPLTTGPTFENVRVVTASGGAGGDGGIGAGGGTGGVGGVGGIARFWCARNGGRGGDGGRGGAAGGGGGGCGGGSHGVYLDGSASDAYVSALSTTTIDETGVAGRGGRGGFSPGSPGTDGRNGDASAVVVAP